MDKVEKNNDTFVELLSLGFDEQLIKQALQITDDKEKAVELILSFQEDLKSNQNVQIQNKSINFVQGTNISQGQNPQQIQQDPKLIIDPQILASIKVDPNLLLNVKQNVPLQNANEQNEYEDEEMDYKMAFLVRQDLKMGVGKIASQVAHAAVESYKQITDQINSQQSTEIRDQYQALLTSWEESGYRKIVLKVENLKELQDLVEKADKLHIQYVIIHDAGKTQVEPNTITVAAIGPGPEEQIDQITKHLKLL